MYITPHALTASLSPLSAPQMPLTPLAAVLHSCTLRTKRRFYLLTRGPPNTRQLFSYPPSFTVSTADRRGGDKQREECTSPAGGRGAALCLSGVLLQDLSSVSCSWQLLQQQRHVWFHLVHHYSPYMLDWHRKRLYPPCGSLRLY